MVAASTILQLIHGIPVRSTGIPASIYIYCSEFRSARRASGHVTRIATASHTGTDNSVVTLLEQRRELVTGGSFNLTTIVPIGHPRRIGLFAKFDLPKCLRE